MHSTYDALVPVQITHDDPRRELPTDEDRAKTTEETKKALDALVSGVTSKVGSPRHCAALRSTGLPRCTRPPPLGTDVTDRHPCIRPPSPAPRRTG